METLGRSLLVIGILFVIIGGVLLLTSRLNLPGDLRIEGENVRIYIPLGTSLLLSLVLTVLLNLIVRLWRK